MHDPTRTPTTTALLESLFHREDPEVWEQYDQRLRPILIRTARRMGLGATDAGDVAQEALIRAVSAGREGQYDRSKGRLQSWILAILRNLTVDCLRSMEFDNRARGDSRLAQIPSETETNEIWREEVRRKIHAEALRLLRMSGEFKENTVRAFERLALDGVPARQVGAELGMDSNAVYVAKHRCMARLSKRIEELTELYELIV
ncbi:MAG: sigma-70 family RNA polymerase sigma factor [bacterium]|nr:sigma-70 family RNA polymerase sigma factor [bacterium]